MWWGECPCRPPAGLGSGKYHAVCGLEALQRAIEWVRNEIAR